MAKNKQFAVLGLGRFGQSIVKTLISNGYDVLCCDNNLEIVKEMSKYANHVVQVDVTAEHALASLGLNNFDVVIVAIGDNMESSIMATLIAKQMGAKMVIAKAKNMIQKSILEKVGADRVVLPERDMGVRIATNLITTNVIDFINLSDKFGIAEIAPKPEWIGKSLQKSNIRATSGLNIVAIKRENKIIVSPRAEEVILEHDIIVAVGENSDIQRLSNQ